MNKEVYSLHIESLENKKLLSIVPNDTNLNNQWGLNSISAYQAWQYGTGSKNVVVAVIDSGIDLTHNDLKNNIWTNIGEIPNDGIDNENNGFVDDVHGWNFANNTNNVQDNYGHGTHIAGIIGAEANNSLGVAGINWNVSIMPLKFMDDSGFGSTGGALSAMNYILMMKQKYNVNVVVANASWGGGTGFSNVLNEQISKLNDAGITLTVAAGNNGSDNDITARYPSCYNVDNIISVGALSSNQITLASFSNYGKNSVDIAAPGGMIYSTISHNNYAYMSGTSMAAPQVAGAVALLKSVKPGLSVSEIKNAIFSSVDKISELFDKVYTGGRLNIARAVCGVLGIPYTVNQAPVGAITSVTLRNISGWTNDPDCQNNSISVKLIIDGAEKGFVVTSDNGGWSFNLGGLVVGDHVINIQARDYQNGSWTNIGSCHVNIPAPVVRVGLLNLDRVRGWAFSQRSGSEPVVVRVLVNGKLVTKQLANHYRPAIVPLVGSAYHGFNMVLNRSWFRKGSNVVTIQVMDPISNQLSNIWRGVVNK